MTEQVVLRAQQMFSGRAGADLKSQLQQAQQHHHLPRQLHTQAVMVMAALVQVFPEPVPLPPPEEGPTEPACKLTSRKPTPKKVPTHTRRPYKKRKQAMLLQPGDPAAAGTFAAFPLPRSFKYFSAVGWACAHEGLAFSSQCISEYLLRRGGYCCIINPIHQCTHA